MVSMTAQDGAGTREVPADLVELSDLAREIAGREGIPLRRVYQRIRNWIRRGKLAGYHRLAGGPVLVSRGAVERLHMLVPLDGIDASE